MKLYQTFVYYWIRAFIPYRCYFSLKAATTNLEVLPHAITLSGDNHKDIKPKVFFARFEPPSIRRGEAKAAHSRKA
jgi:hypothetical protein